jgi:hypothetical protein
MRVLPGLGRPVGEADVLFAEVYRWQLNEDLWVSVPAEKVEAAREALVGQFDPAKPIEERGFERFLRALEFLESLSVDGQTSWHESEQPLPLGEGIDDELTFRCNAIVSACRHLRWIHDVFCTVPSANVTVR